MELWPLTSDLKPLASAVLYSAPRISIIGFHGQPSCGIRDIVHPKHDVCFFVRSGEIILRFLNSERSISLTAGNPIIIKAGTTYSFTTKRDSKFIRIMLGQDADHQENLTKNGPIKKHWNPFRKDEKMQGWLSDHYLALCAERIKVTVCFHSAATNQYGQHEEKIEVNEIGFISHGLRQYPIPFYN